MVHTQANSSRSSHGQHGAGEKAGPESGAYPVQVSLRESALTSLPENARQRQAERLNPEQSDILHALEQDLEAEPRAGAGAPSASEQRVSYDLSRLTPKERQRREDLIEKLDRLPGKEQQADARLDKRMDKLQERLAKGEITQRQFDNKSRNFERANNNADNKRDGRQADWQRELTALNERCKVVPGTEPRPPQPTPQPRPAPAPTPSPAPAPAPKYSPTPPAAPQREPVKAPTQIAPPDPWAGRETAWLAAVPAQERKELERRITILPLPSKELTFHLMDSKHFAELTASEKKQVLETSLATNVAGRGNLGILLNREFGPQGETALHAKDAHGRTVLQNLHDVATKAELADPALTRGARREEIIASLAEELGQPGKINQGSHGTCAATSPLWEFATRDPGELSGLNRDLLVNGKAEMRKDGEFLVLERDAIEPDYNSRRSITERIAQSSLMEYANGASQDYVNSKDRHFSADQSKDLGSGLNSSQSIALMSAFYDQEFEDMSVGSKRTNTEVFDKVKDEVAERGVAQVGLRWSDKAADAKTGSSELHGYHAVAVTRITEDRVYFRNPWGATSDPNGKVYTDSQYPQRRVEERNSGLESLPLEEFRARLSSAELEFNGPAVAPQAASQLSTEAKDLLLAWNTKKLPAETQHAIDTCIRRTDFREMTPKVQARILEIYATNQKDPALVQLLTTHTSTSLFSVHKEKEQLKSLSVYSSANSASIAGLSSKARENLENVVKYCANEEASSALINTVSSPEFNALSAKDKDAFLAVAERAYSSDMTKLCNLLSTKRPGANVTVLLERDSSGNTLLTNLDEITKGKTVLGLSEKERPVSRLTSNLIAHIYEGNDGSLLGRIFGTSGPVDVSSLAKNNPAELSRLVREVALNGETRLPGQPPLKLAAGKVDLKNYGDSLVVQALKGLS